MKSICIRTSSVAQAPKKIKLFTNRQAIGFEDVEDAQEPDAAQVLELSEEEVSEGRPIKLKFVRFQSLESLHVSFFFLYFDRDPSVYLLKQYFSRPLRSLWRQTKEAKTRHVLTRSIYSATLSSMLSTFLNNELVYLNPTMTLSNRTTKDLSNLRRQEE